MTGKLQETLEETQRRLALGGVTTAPMMQTLDTAPRKRRGTVATVVLVFAALAVAFVLALVGLFILGVLVGAE
jgi:hypothetical protein